MIGIRPSQHDDIFCVFLQGLYEITCPSVRQLTGEDMMSFVVMENVFRSSVVTSNSNTTARRVERYDLKGSQGERSVGSGAYIRAIPRAAASCTESNNGSSDVPKFSGVYLDFDFLQRLGQISLPTPSLADELHHQLIADAVFLHSQKVLDYSLLIGVSGDGDGVTGQRSYEVAIIDTLTAGGAQRAVSMYSGAFMKLITSIVQ
jgi:hypothetical protein